jgi:hypothetical protein
MVEALYSSHPLSSLRYDPPASREYFARAIRAHDRHAHLAARATGIAVGSVRFSRGTAIVVITGTLCPGARTSQPASQVHCVTNHDGRTRNPDFLVYLRQAGSHWYLASNPAVIGDGDGQASTRFATTTPSPS